MITDILSHQVPAFEQGLLEEHGPVMRYYQLPEEVLEDTDTLRRWADRSIAGARERRRRPTKPRR